MEYINKVELQGVVGAVKRITAQGGTQYRSTLCTLNCYRTSNGMPVIESTWFNVLSIEKTPGELNWLEKGKWVHLTGRIQIMRYIGSDGAERTEVVVRADNLIYVRDNGTERD